MSKVYTIRLQRDFRIFDFVATTQFFSKNKTV